MVSNYGFRILSYLLICNVCLSQSSISFARLVNYENDPDLALAMKYDAEYNGGDLTIANQSLAEKNYLKYLEKCKESSQRAKVYCQLGVLFATNWYAQNGEKPDYEKSVMYMKKVLEEEPVRIGQETQRARAFLNTPLASREESMNLRMQHYEWLLKTKSTIESASPASEIWLPIVPGEPLSTDKIESFKSLYMDSLSVQASNLVGCADSYPDPIDKILNLQKIIDRFPNTDAAKEAVSRLSIVREKMQKNMDSERVVKTILNEPLKNIQSPESNVADSNTNRINIRGKSIMAFGLFVLVSSVFYIACRRYLPNKFKNK